VPRAEKFRPTPAFAARILDTLEQAHPEARCALHYRSAFELSVATILSAQCTDKMVNQVTPSLFAAYPTPADLAAAPAPAVETLVKRTGFFRQKTKSIQGVARTVADEHGGQVPADMDVLTTLPGVGRKTANVVLGNACGINAGVVVDTHVQRVAARLGLTSETDPEKIERVLMDLFARDRWTLLSHLLIWHGRRVCEARKPRCENCTLSIICPSAFKV
jgi:endonuclease III